MTADAHFRVPEPYNEPVRSYAPGTPERRSVKQRLAELTDARTEIAMTIGGVRRKGTSTGTLRAPHRHQRVGHDGPQRLVRAAVDVVAGHFAALFSRGGAGNVTTGPWAAMPGGR